MAEFGPKLRPRDARSKVAARGGGLSSSNAGPGLQAPGSPRDVVSRSEQPAANDAPEAASSPHTPGGSAAREPAPPHGSPIFPVAAAQDGPQLLLDQACWTGADRRGSGMRTAAGVPRALIRVGVCALLVGAPLGAAALLLIARAGGSWPPGLASSPGRALAALFPLPNSFAAPGLLLAFVLLEAALLLLLPGKAVHGPTTATGHRPAYVANGVEAFLITLAIEGGLLASGLLPPAALTGALLAECMTLSQAGALLACAALVLKGRVAPSTADSGTSGDLAFDFYWGTELYPRVSIGARTLDIKQLVNCRLGMMAWAVVVVAFAAAQAARDGALSDALAVSAALQLVYIAKFFVWEAGYLNSIDISHDRAGFMLIWGCLVFVPFFYTSPALFLWMRPVHLGAPLALTLLAAGLAAIYVNYDADRQRQRFRATGGREHIWGSPPVSIPASYSLASGETRTTALLASGWWGPRGARHVHYLPELLAALFWTLPNGSTSGVAPYAYVAFLTVLLVDRSYRVDARCRRKYGRAWAAYEAAVPARIVPGVW